MGGKAGEVTLNADDVATPECAVGDCLNKDTVWEYGLWLCWEHVESMSAAAPIDGRACDA